MRICVSNTQVINPLIICLAHAHGASRSTTTASQTRTGFMAGSQTPRSSKQSSDAKSHQRPELFISKAGCNSTYHVRLAGSRTSLVQTRISNARAPITHPKPMRVRSATSSSIKQRCQCKDTERISTLWLNLSRKVGSDKLRLTAQHSSSSTQAVAGYTAQLQIPHPSASILRSSHSSEPLAPVSPAQPSPTSPTFDHTSVKQDDHGLMDTVPSPTSFWTSTSDNIHTRSFWEY